VTNIPNFSDTHHGGILGGQGGFTATLQNHNRMLVLTSPHAQNNVKDIFSLQATVALYNFELQPAWEIYIDGQRVTTFPAAAKAQQRITIKDGVSYVGLIPLPSTDLGRDAEVLIKPFEGKVDHGIKPTLLLEQYNYRSSNAIDRATADWKRIDRAYGGFAVELGDVTEYADFAAFQKHLNETKLATRWDEQTGLLAVNYTSGTNVLACTMRPEYFTSEQLDTPTDQCFPTRTVNGQWPYLAPGILRDNPLTQQGTTGRLEKNGAVVRSEFGRMAYLQTEPVTGTYSGFNPLPDPSYWAMEAPGGITAQADGQVGLLRLTLRPRENKVWLDYGVKPGTPTNNLASALLVFGLTGSPAVVINDVLRKESPATVTVDGKLACVIPLGDNPATDLVDRWRRAQTSLRIMQQPGSHPAFLQDWYVMGPFFNNYLGDGLTTVNPPETVPVNLHATYKNHLTNDVAWVHTLDPGRPALARMPVELQRFMNPKKEVCAYATTTIASDVVAFLGVNDRVIVSFNGKEVFRYPFYRVGMPDQYRIPLHLNAGANTVLLKLAHGGEGWPLYFRVGDESGLPVTDGVTCGFGTAP
jgi:hypothetical protein